MPSALAVAIPEDHAVRDEHARLSMPTGSYAWSAAPYAAPICFTVTNTRPGPLMMPNSAPWLIEDAHGEVVYSPLALQAVWHLGPGKSVRDCWDGLDMVDSTPGTPGGYVVRWSYAPDARSDLRTLGLPFSLHDPLVQPA